MPRACASLYLYVGLVPFWKCKNPADGWLLLAPFLTTKPYYNTPSSTGAIPFFSIFIEENCNPFGMVFAAFRDDWSLFSAGPRSAFDGADCNRSQTAFVNARASVSTEYEIFLCFGYGSTLMCMNNNGDVSTFSQISISAEKQEQ